jgi:hypothetical protein
MHYVTSRKVAAAIPDEAIELFFFNLPNSSSRTMALGFTQPLTEMSTRKCVSGTKRSRRLRLTTSSPSVSWLSRQCGNLDVSLPCGPPRSVIGIALLFFRS